MKVPFSTVENMHLEIRDEMAAAFRRIYDKGWFINGEEVSAFEREFAEYCGTKYCIGCATGLDALSLILRGYDIGEGDEVIVPSNTFIATALAVSNTGARPVFVGPDLTTFHITPDRMKELSQKKQKRLSRSTYTDLSRR